MAKKKTLEIKTSKPYIVKLSLKNGEEYSGEGETLIDAMSAIRVDGNIKSLGKITVTYEDKKVERILNALRLQRIFGILAKSWVRELALKTYAKFLNTGLL